MAGPKRRSPTSDDPLPIAREVRAGRLPDDEPTGGECRRYQRLRAALAVRAADQHAPQAQLWVAEPAEQRPHPAESEPDPDVAARAHPRERIEVA